MLNFKVLIQMVENIYEIVLGLIKVHVHVSTLEMEKMQEVHDALSLVRSFLGLDIFTNPQK